MRQIPVCIVFLCLPLHQLLAARAPDDKTKADYVVAGKVVTIYKKVSGRLTGYIVRLSLADVEKGGGYNPGETFYAYCYQRQRSPLVLADDLGHSAVPEEGDMIRAYIHRRKGEFEGNFPDWFEKLEVSETLKTEMSKLIEETVKAAKKSGDAAKTADSKTVFALLLAQIRDTNPLFLYVEPEQENAWKANKFDEKAANVRIQGSIKLLADYNVALPRLHQRLIKEFHAGTLTGVRRELAAELLEAQVAKFVQGLTGE